MHNLEWGSFYVLNLALVFSGFYSTLLVEYFYLDSDTQDIFPRKDKCVENILLWSEEEMVPMAEISPPTAKQWQERGLHYNSS